MFRGAELRSRNGGSHTEDRHMDKEKHATGAQGGHNTFLIFAKVLSFSRDPTRN